MGGYNHLALASKDIAATHRFYTEVMGFRLAKVVAGGTPSGRGWSRHVFYDCGGGQLMAFWDLHDEEIGDGWKADIAESVGLPGWVNHVAFDAPDEATFTAHVQRWREHGITVLEVDHGFCRSIYTNDPDGHLVEFCLMVRPLDEHDAEEAERLLWAERPPLEGAPPVTVHHPLAPAAPVA